jgi:hypothetical protein
MSKYSIITTGSDEPLELQAESADLNLENGTLKFANPKDGDAIFNWAHVISWREVKELERRRGKMD